MECSAKKITIFVQILNLIIMNVVGGWLLRSNRGCKPIHIMKNGSNRKMEQNIELQYFTSHQRITQYSDDRSHQQTLV